VLLTVSPYLTLLYYTTGMANLKIVHTFWQYTATRRAKAIKKMGQQWIPYDKEIFPHAILRTRAFCSVALDYAVRDTDITHTSRGSSVS